MSALTKAKRTDVRAPLLHASSPQQPKSSVSPARIAAAQVLSAVWAKKGHSDDLLHGSLLSGLSQEDRNLTTALVLGVLRWQIALDARILPLLARPDAVVADEVLLPLRLGAFQMLHMDRIPVHAAINESVELVRVAGHPHATGMVNAVLRKLGALPPVRKPLHESVAMVAERLGHPSWLVERWVKNYGRDAAMAIGDFNQHEPRCGDLFGEANAENLPILDDGSRLVAEITAASMPAAERIWDCCAAPGGKTLVLAKRHPGAMLLATDASPKRLKSLDERLRSLGNTVLVQTKVADAAMIDAVNGMFDLILCDVPCSGTGTLARNPEIRHQLRPSDLSRQVERQKAILQNSLRHLAPGGSCVYSTCSLEPEECERVVEDVLASATDIESVSVDASLAALQSAGILSSTADISRCVQSGMLRTLPGFNLQADGFFATVLTRR